MVISGTECHTHTRQLTLMSERRWDRKCDSGIGKEVMIRSIHVGNSSRQKMRVSGKLQREQNMQVDESF